VDQYQFTMLSWLSLSERDAKTGSRWYRGSGWYYNPLDEKGNKLDVQCVSNSEQAHDSTAQFAALNRCGMEGWSVAAFLPAVPPNGPYFILQRRASS
jgi:hypothetical protein